MPVIAAKDIELVVVHYSGVGVPGAWAGLNVGDFLNRPFTGVNRVLVEIVYSVKAIIASENIDAAIVYHCRVSVARAGRGIVDW